MADAPSVPLGDSENYTVETITCSEASVTFEVVVKGA